MEQPSTKAAPKKKVLRIMDNYKENINILQYSSALTDMNRNQGKSNSKQHLLTDNALSTEKQTLEIQKKLKQRMQQSVHKRNISQSLLQNIQQKENITPNQNSQLSSRHNPKNVHHNAQNQSHEPAGLSVNAAIKPLGTVKSTA